MRKYTLTNTDKDILQDFAHYVWWENKDFILKNNPLRIVASAMNDANDLPSFTKIDMLDKNLLKLALKNAKAGWFNAKSWTFWHYRLYGLDIKIPPLPKRGYLQ